ncbi:MAG: Fur family transcriptional regulator [Planctomycetota bacterium]|nr:Fur family transcriptional regulator [Planctomycetota bacterium]
MVPGEKSHPTPEFVREVFRRHDLRCTHQREMVFVGLWSMLTHPTADELYQTLHAQDPNISLATVYNTLDALSEVGLVRKLPSPSGPCRYDAEMSPHVHIAMPDGRIMDAPPEVSSRLLAALPESVLRDLESSMGIAVAGVQLQVVAARPQ